MSVASANRIYEKNSILMSAMDKAVSSLNLNTNDIIFVNISYHEDKSIDTLYYGMKYIINLRGEQKDNSPVLFYGFESLASLKKKSNVSILDSLTVEYIQMPFTVRDLENKIKMLLSYGVEKQGVDELSEKAYELEKKIKTEKLINVFKHDVLNALSTVQIAYKLKRSGTEDIQRRNRVSVKNSLLMEKDKLSEIIAQLGAINFRGLLSSNDIVRIRELLQSSASKYKTLIKSLDPGSNDNKDVIISTAETIEGLLNGIIMILKEIKL